ncbi:MAG: DNA polymerase III subunit gamma/tau [Candidatus Omnitrophota bacterium]|nr:MAG: DNA polymerase III subunit gamma/tau [Candidatus Omnitrophota bacterium]
MEGKAKKNYLVFARKYRPQRFEEIIGQEHIARSLRNAISNRRIAHAYLFAGARGIGKTSTARILAKALNCLNGPTPDPCQKCVFCREITQGISMDVIEIDAASNRGIEEIRSLRENVKFAPAQGRFKIYIVDEVHMLTPEAFNALLKTLEEPPGHIKFIFATTQPERIPTTILSRCQRFDFRRISTQKIVEQLERISREEKVEVEEGALFAIARFAEGSMRDAESILDQVVSFGEGKIKEEDVHLLLGTIGQDCLFEFTQTIVEKEIEKGLSILDRIIKEGKEIEQFMKELSEHFRNLIIAKEGLFNLIELSEERKSGIVEQSKRFSLSELFYILTAISHTRQMIRTCLDKRVWLEFFFLKMVNRDSFLSLEEILKRLRTLKGEEGAGGDKEKVSEEKEREVKKDEIKKDKDCFLGELKEIWKECVEDVGKERMSLATFLEKGKLLSVEGSKAKIGFPADFSFYYQNLQREENRRIVEKVISRRLNREAKVEFLLMEEKESSKSESLPSSVKKAMEIFGGKILK